MKAFIVLKYVLITCCCLVLHEQNLLAQPNILENNKALIEKLAKFETIYQIDSNFIRYQTKETASINYGFGVADKKTGEIIFPAQKDISYFITAYGKYIALSKKHSLAKKAFGLIDNSGKIILDFKYDRIGSVFVPLPDSLITVQLSDKFGVFNTNTQALSPLVYNNTNNALNDGYAYHEGGAWRANEIVYNQLGLKGFKKQPAIFKDIVTKAKIIANDSVAYLVNRNGEKISKNYDYDLEKLHGALPSEFYIGAVKDSTSEHTNARKLYLINSDGREVTEISTALNERTPYFIELERRKSFYFIETEKIVTIPDGYYSFVNCYAKEGFLGFRNLKTDQKLFIDKYGNQTIIGLPPKPKPVIVTQQLSQAEINEFKQMVTNEYYLGRVTKFQYNNDNKLYKETGFDFEKINQPKLSWEDTYHYHKTGTIERISRYDGHNDPYDLDNTENNNNTTKTYNTKKQLKSSVFIKDDYKYEEYFSYNKQGNLIEKICKTTFGNEHRSKTKSSYKYNAKNQEVKEEIYRDDKLDYTYITNYDSQNRKTKYDMVNSKGISTGVWLYLYNAENQVSYKINLYGLKDEKKLEKVEGAPPMQSN